MGCRVMTQCFLTVVVEWYSAINVWRRRIDMLLELWGDIVRRGN